jgi:hypothetical protein
MDEIYTEWYPEDTLPVRNGVYQIRWIEDGHIWYAKFSNGYWYEPWLNFNVANAEENYLAAEHYTNWRGLTKESHDYMAMSFIDKFLMRVFG